MTLKEYLDSNNITEFIVNGNRFTQYDYPLFSCYNNYLDEWLQKYKEHEVVSVRENDMYGIEIYIDTFPDNK